MNLAVVDDPVWTERMDPLADEAVRALMAEGGVAAVNTSLELLSNEPPRDAWPTALRTFVSGVPVPQTADLERVEVAQESFTTFGVLGITILGCASLPETYCLPGIAKLLGMSGQLTHHVGRRLVMTAQMLFDVMAPGGLLPGGRAQRAILRTRLMHAALRHMLLNDIRRVEGAMSAPLREKAFEWTAEYGKPINQLELAYTLMTFSHVVLRSAVRLGIEPDTERFEDYIYTWNVVGRMLGIDDALLPDSRAEAEALFERIKARHAAPSEYCADLTGALHDFWCQDWPQLVRPMASPVWYMMCDTLLDAKTRAMLDIKAPDTLAQHEVDHLLSPLRFGLRLAERVFLKLPSTAHLAAIAFQHWANKRTAVGDGGLYDTYRHLQASWLEPAERPTE